MSEEKKELNSEQLEKVSGGGWLSKMWEKAKDAVTNATNNINEEQDSN